MIYYELLLKFKLQFSFYLKNLCFDRNLLFCQPLSSQILFGVVAIS